MISAPIAAIAAVGADISVPNAIIPNPIPAIQSTGVFAVAASIPNAAAAINSIQGPTMSLSLG